MEYLSICKTADNLKEILKTLASMSQLNINKSNPRVQEGKKRLLSVVKEVGDKNGIRS